MSFFDQAGIMAIGTRLRMLSEKMAEDASKIYEMYHVDIKPKWFPVFYVLSQSQEKSITQIAIEIGHSHPSVSKISKEMIKAGIAIEQKDPNDARKNNLQLSEKGKHIATLIEEQYTDVQEAVDHILRESSNNMWKAIKEFEFLLNQKSMLQRVKEQKKQRELKKVQIIPYRSEHRDFFKNVNIAWITQHFKMEKSDYLTLENPEEYILDKGGSILVALYDQKPIGVCALIKMDHPKYEYELAKMAVSSEAKGKGIGWYLGKAILEKAAAMGARHVYLESNTVLKPAINLYHKLGFKKVIDYPSPYERCNIQMGIELNSN